MKKLLLIALCIPLGLACSDCIPVFSGGKVVSLSPSVTELVIFLGGTDRLCGRSSACYFPEVQHLVAVGDMGRPFPEAVVQSGARLVICDVKHPEANWKILQRCRVETEFLDTGNIDSLPDNMRKLGKLLNIDGAEEKAALAEEKLDHMHRRSAGEKLTDAVILFGTAPLISCGKESFITGAMELAGVKNIAADAGSGYFILSPEFLHQKDPQLIIIAGVPENIARHDLGSGLLNSLSAVKNDRIIFVDVNKWGKLTPDILDAAENLYRRLH